MSENLFEISNLHGAGKLKPRRTLQIASSPISVGFETLDRYHFDPKKTYPHLAELGAKWARVQTGWNRCEREQGVYDFTWLDEVVDDLLRIGVQPFFNLGFGNLLYTPDAPHDSARGYVAFYYGDEAAAAWRNFVDALTRYFADRVSHWEVWNEPNTGGFWNPKAASPKDYVRLLRETVPIVRANVASATVIGGVFAAVHPVHALSFGETCFREGMGECGCPFPGAVVSATAWHGTETPWETPVLIDPVTQTFYELPTDNISPEGGTFSLPVLDGPLLLADSAMLEREGLINVQ